MDEKNATPPGMAVNDQFIPRAEMRDIVDISLWAGQLQLQHGGDWNAFALACAAASVAMFVRQELLPSLLTTAFMLAALAVGIAAPAHLFRQRKPVV